MARAKEEKTVADAQSRVRVRGRVQGVWFRASARDEALGLGLAGWVRNCPDGSVELLARGPREAVDRLVEWCRRGPPGARVDAVERVDEAPAGRLVGFEIRR